MKFVHLTSLTFCFAVPFAKIEHGSVYDESLRRSPRVNWPDGFEEACILQPCDEMTFFELIPIEDEMEGMETVMLHAQYEVCLKFTTNLRQGCPEVTKMVSKYPQLIDVIMAVSRTPGVSSSLRGKYTIANYAESALRRQCMQTRFVFDTR